MNDHGTDDAVPQRPQDELRRNAAEQGGRERERTEREAVVAAAEAAAPTSPEGRDTLRRALARTGVLDVFGDQDEAVVGAVAEASPDAAAVVAGWIDTAFETGRSRRPDSPA
ncbi:hypothetical protein [Streptomyces sp. CA-251247]|uniref:hypothetical protein n=1 Tax=Streptomyces sp. CA-251247 TaxID=3240062 RepID=UPI003D8CB001